MTSTGFFRFPGWLGSIAILVFLAVSPARLSALEGLWIWQSAYPTGKGCDMEHWYEFIIRKPDGTEIQTGLQRNYIENIDPCDWDACDSSHVTTGVSGGIPDIKFPPIDDLFHFLYFNGIQCSECSEGGLNLDDFDDWSYNPTDVPPDEEPPPPVPRPITQVAFAAASQAAFSIGLGPSAYGSDLGSIIINPDLASDAPLTVYDLDRIVGNAIDFLQVQRVIVPVPWGSPAIHQFVSHNLLIQIEEVEGGSLKFKSFALDDTAPAAGEQHYLIPESASPISFLVVSRATQSNLPGMRMTGVYMGKAFDSFFSRIQEPGVGGFTLHERNNRKREVVDQYVEDTLDWDGYCRISQVSDFHRDPASQVWIKTAEKTITSRTLFNGKEVILSEETALANGATATTSFEYDEVLIANGALNKAYGKLIRRTNADGSWVVHQHDMEGRVWRTLKPWLDGSAVPPSSGEADCVAEVFTHFPPDSPWAGEMSALTRINGIEVSQRTVTIQSEGTNELLIHTTVEREKGTSLSGEIIDQFLTTKRTFERLPNGSYSLVSIRTPDNLTRRFIEERGVFDETTGAFQPDPDGSHTAIHDYQKLDFHGNGRPMSTIRTITIKDAAGRKLLISHGRHQGGQYYPVFDGRRYEYDNDGRLVRERLLNGDVEREYAYTQEGDYAYKSTTDRSGIVTLVISDASNESFETRIQNASVENLNGPYGQGPYLVPGRRQSTLTFAGVPGTVLEVQITEGFDTPPQSITTIRDAVGRALYEIDQTGLLTTRSWSDNGRVETATLPGGSTRITTRHRDGQLASVTGTSAIPVFITRLVNGDGTLTETTRHGSANSPRWQRVIRSFGGRILREEAPSPADASEVVATNYGYDALGRLFQISKPGISVVNYAYTNDGQIYAKTQYSIDNDGNSTTAPGTSQQSRFTGPVIYFIDGSWWEVSTEAIHTVDGITLPQEIIYTSRNEIGVGSRARTHRTLPDGSALTSTPAVDLGSGLRTVTHLLQRPDGTTHETIEYYVGGQLAGRRDQATGLLATYHYDGLGRMTLAHDPSRHGSDITEYSGYWEAGGRLAMRSVGQNITQYEYYPSDHPHAGRVSKIWQPNVLDFPLPETHYEYDSQGREIRRHGPGTYPVERVYDDYGHLHQMKTWRDLNQPPDITTWHYDPATGVLLSKTDAKNRTTTYTYDEAGRVKTRTNARGVTTTYAYNGAGALTGITYSDGTPSVTHLHDRAGRLIQTTDASGTRQFNHTPSASGSRELSVVYQDGPLDGWSIERPPDTSGRPAGWQAKYQGGVKASSTWAYVGGSDRLQSLSLGTASVSYQYTHPITGAPYLVERGLPPRSLYSGTGLQHRRHTSEWGTSTGSNYILATTPETAVVSQWGSRHDRGKLTHLA